MLRSILLLVPFLVIGGCRTVETAPRVSTGRYLFEVTYTNYAWGYNHRGMYVDSAGRIHTFTWPRSGEHWEPRESETYTDAELAAKYAPGAMSGGSVQPDSLNAMLDQMRSASEGSFSDTTRPMADAGVTRSSLYLYDPAEGTYRRIPLRQRGDFRFDNLAPSARTLADMLERYWSEAVK